jgi:acetyl-CoA acyltransferase
MREVIIASSVRTPVGRAYKGTLRATRPDELAAVAIKGALERVPQLDAKEIEDVILGCAMPEAEQGMNVARIASLRAGLPVEVSALTINRFCSSGLQAIAMAAERIMSGGAEVIVAGGTESMSMIPMGGHKISPNPWLVDNYPGAYLTMGLTAERVAQRVGITREAADEFSLRSHQKALAAIQAGKFADEVVSVPVSFSTPNGSKPKRQEITFKVDEGPTRRYVARSAARAQAGVSREGHGDGRKFVADVGRRSRSRGHVGRACEGAGHPAAGSLCCFRDRWIQAGRNGTRPGVRDSEGAENGWAQAR